MSSEITAVYTKFGWVSQKALYVLKKGYEDAVAKGLYAFRPLGCRDVMLTQFAGYLIEFLENEGLVPIKTDDPVVIFEQAQGSA